MAMHNIRDLVDNTMREIAQRQQPAREYAPVTEISDDAKIIMDDVFKELKGSCSAYSITMRTPEDEAMVKKVWTKAFIEAGLVDLDAVKRGLRRVRHDPSDYIPSVGKFIGWCKPDPKELGLPPVDVAYAEVIRRLPPSHPIVVKIAKATSFERGTLTETEYKRVFARHYEILVERIMKGETFDYEVPKGVGSEATHSPEYYTTKGRQGVATLRRLFRQNQADHSPVLHGNEIAGLIDNEKELGGR